MKLQSTTALLSAVFLSILSIDYNGAQSHNDQCQWVCPNVTKHMNLNISFNKPAGLIGLVTSKNTAAAFDLLNNFQLVFNGTCGGYVVANLTSGSAKYYNCSKAGWLAKNETFLDYLNRHTTFGNLVKKSKGSSISNNDNSPEIQKFVGGAISTFSKYFADIVDESKTISALKLLTDLAITVTQHRSFLNQILQLTKNTDGDNIFDDIHALAFVLQGMGNFASVIQGGVAALAEKNVTFDFKKIESSTRGSDILNSLISFVKDKADLNDLFGDTFSDPLCFTNFINQFYGYQGLSNALAQIVALISYNTTIDNSLISLIDFATNDIITNEVVPLEEDWTNAFNTLYTATSSIKNNCLKAIVNNDFFVNDVNVSAAINVLYSKGSMSGLELSVRIVLHLEKSISLKTSISHLIIDTFLLDFIPDIGTQLLLEFDPNYNFTKPKISLSPTNNNLTIYDFVNREDAIEFFDEFRTLWQITLDVKKALLAAKGPLLEEIFDTDDNKEILNELLECLVLVLGQKFFNA